MISVVLRTNVFTSCVAGKRHRPVVHLVRCREAFRGPVKEAVEKDEPGKTSPRPHDHVEGDACIVDELGRGDRGRNLLVYSNLKVRFLPHGGNRASYECNNDILSPCKVFFMV